MADKVTKVVGSPLGHTEGEVINYISQVDLGGVKYDLATHHKINFQNGGTSIPWNGLEDITVVIPDVSDLVTKPINFVGIIDGSGNIVWNETGHIVGVGDLVYAAADSTFNGIAIEAGDMAICMGVNDSDASDDWKVVSGENQVTILAGSGNAADGNVTTVSITGAAKRILNVEGRELAINIDYADVKDHISGTKQTLDVAFKPGANTVSVGAVNVGLTKASDAPTTIGKSKTISTATALANGTVVFADTSHLNYFKSGDISSNNFNSGSFPVLSLNASTSWDVTGSVTSDKTFVTSVDAVGTATLVSAASATNGAVALVSEVTASTTDNYITGFEAATAGESGSFSWVTNVTTDNTKTDFLKGFGNASDAVTSVSDEDDKVITAATIGAVTIDNATSASHDVITGTSTGTDYLASADLVTDNSSTHAQSVIATAIVENGVLKFTSSTAMAPVKLSVSTRGFTYGKVSQANSSFKTRSVIKGGYNVTSNNYKWTTSNSVTVNDSKTYVSISTTAAGVGTDSVGTLNLVGGKASVPENTYVIGATAGTLPSFTTPTATGVLEASVATELTTESVSFLEAASTTISLPGAYSLTNNTSEENLVNYITVGASGDAALNLVATVSGVVTDVKVDDGASFKSIITDVTPTPSV